MASFHPEDLNLYAVLCDDGNLVVKNILLTRHQVIKMRRPPVFGGDGTSPPREPFLFFTPGGVYLTLCYKDAGGTVSLVTHRVPPYAITPSVVANHAREKEACEPSTSEERKPTKDEKRKEVNKMNNEWVEEVEREGRGDKLLSTDPVNMIHLPTFPLAIVPKPIQPKDRALFLKPRGATSPREFAVVLFPQECAMYQIGGGAIMKTAAFSLPDGCSPPDELTCVVALRWPSLALDGTPVARCVAISSSPITHERHPPTYP